MIANPSPSPPRRDVSAIIAFSAVTGRESFPRRPKPSYGRGIVIPGVFAGTSQSVLAPSALTGLLDHT
jgi:hypothetical protein